jgi:hypothetical protein
MKPWVSEDHAIFSEVCDKKLDTLFPVSELNVEVDRVSDFPRLVWGSINVVDWSWYCEFVGSESKSYNCLVVNEVSCCSTVDECYFFCLCHVGFEIKWNFEGILF